MWYPGHVAKAKKRISELLKAVNFVLEIRDARAPFATGAYDRRKLLRGKRTVIVLNKADIAEDPVTENWVDYFKERRERVVVSKKGDRSKKLIKEIFGERMEAKVLVVGLPNVGKSSFINRVKGKRSVKVGGVPGVTRGVQWIQVGDRIKILDTPGVIYTDLFSKRLIAKLLLVGVVTVEMLDDWAILEEAFTILVSRYPGVVAEKIGKVSNLDDALKIYGEKHGILVKGGEVDLNVSAQKMFHEIASGKWGKMSFERPEEVENP